MNEIQNLMKQEELQNSLFNDACVIIEQARTVAYKSVDEILIKRNWLLGMRIQHEVLKDKRAEYGEQVIKKLAKDLSEKYGSGYSRNNLYRYISFYKSFGGIFEMKSEGLEIVPSVMGQSQIVPSLMGLSYETNLYDLIKPIKPIRLSWTHYSIILQESDAGARIWYENEAANEKWSTRTLQRNISSQYYHRLLKSQNQNVAHYSVLNGNDQLYATRYLTFMPTKEELRREIERQKEIFMLQHQVSK